MAAQGPASRAGAHFAACIAAKRSTWNPFCHLPGKHCRQLPRQRATLGSALETLLPGSSAPKAVGSAPACWSGRESACAFPWPAAWNPQRSRSSGDLSLRNAASAQPQFLKHRRCDFLDRFGRRIEPAYSFPPHHFFRFSHLVAAVGEGGVAAVGRRSSRIRVPSGLDGQPGKLAAMPLNVPGRRPRSKSSGMSGNWPP